MKKINWVQKLTSRKFWVSLAGLATAIMVLNKTDTSTQEQVTALIMAAASVVAYIVGEGLVDANRSTGKEETTAEKKEELDK